MDTLIRDGIVVTCDPKDRIVAGDVLVRGREIAAIGKLERRDVLSRGMVRVLDASGCAVMPGFVQAHVHLCQALLRGMADDLPLLEWLRERIWPLEAAHDEASLAASAELGLCEMMLAGTTCILDMGTVRGHDAVMDACARSGIRAVSGKAMMDTGDGVPGGLRESTRESLAESESSAGDGRGQPKAASGTRSRRASSCRAPRRSSAARSSGPATPRCSCTRTRPSTPPSATPCAPLSATTTSPSSGGSGHSGHAPSSRTASS